MSRSATDILRAAAAVCGCRVDEIRSHARDRHLLFIRAAVSLICRRDLGCSLTRIGRVVNRDHTTVLDLLRIYGGDRRVLALADQIIAVAERPSWRERAQSEMEAGRAGPEA